MTGPEPEIPPEAEHFLGLDLSTQQLKAILLDAKGQIEHETAVHFDNDLPKYGTTNGAIVGNAKEEVTSPVGLWVEAVDLLLERMKGEGIQFDKIRGISGAGQQHGSVYWSHKAAEILSSLNPGKSLGEQLLPAAFSIQDSPIWQDSSTGAECRALEDAVGGAQALADITGSRAYERFTGPQIAKIRRTNPTGYEQTARISLVSSFIPSLFLGDIAPIEISDASGMNLTNVLTHEWQPNLLEKCGGSELKVKLGPEPVPGGTVLGKVSKWVVERYGFSPECIVAPFTGDNPATMVSLASPGDAILSLGTSTTFLLSIPPSHSPPKRFTTSHLLSHPTDLTSQIAMLCYKNGALAREQVRNRYADGHWHIFNELIESTPPGNDGFSGFYFPFPEIIPPNVQGEFFFKDHAGTGEVISEAEVPQTRHPRAILESQFLSIKARIAAILPADAPHLHRLVLTGGSSQNQTFRQFAADVFGLPAYVAETKEAAGRGGALLALYAWKKLKDANCTFGDVTAGMEDGTRLVAEPNAGVAEVYDGLVKHYEALEARVRN